MAEPELEVYGPPTELEYLRELRDNWFKERERLAAEIARLRLAPDEREAINAMACYFDTKGSIQMQAWGSLLRVILLRNDRLGSE